MGKNLVISSSPMAKRDRGFCTEVIPHMEFVIIDPEASDIEGDTNLVQVDLVDDLWKQFTLACEGLKI